MSCTTCTRANQNINTPNLMFAQEVSQSMVSIHADYPRFEQVSQSQFNALVTALGQTNSQVAKNSSNLIKVGKDTTKLGQDATYFGNEITKLKSQPTGTGFNKSQVENILKDFYGDDIDRLNENHKQQEDRITQGFNHRTEIESKVDTAVLEHEDFHNKLFSLGGKLNEAKSERDRLDLKIDTKHLGDGIIPEFPALPTGLILGALGIGAFMLMRK